MKNVPWLSCSYSWFSRCRFSLGRHIERRVDMGVSCPGEGTSYSGGGTFTASNALGFSGGGSCTRTSSHFTLFTSTPRREDTGSGLFVAAAHPGDSLIVPPSLTTETTPIYLVSSACPWFNKNLNWLFVQWDTETRTLDNTFVLGTASYSTASGINVTSQYNVTGAPYWLGLTPMPGTCSGGVYSISGQTSADLDGTVYFTSDGSGVFKTTPGHATFFFPGVCRERQLGSWTGRFLEGIEFDSYQTSSTRNIVATSNAAGTAFTVISMPIRAPEPWTPPARATRTRFRSRR